MDITYRTLGPWGSGKGANLQPAEVDTNFYSLAQAIVALETNPAQPVGIASITVSGTQMYISLTDGTVLGPYTLPVLTFRWRGEWEPAADYVALDVVTVYQTGIFMCQVSHTSSGGWDTNLEIDGNLVWLQLFGSTDASLSGLSDVQITDIQPGNFLTWGGSFWYNVMLGGMAYQDYSDVYITGGRITGLPAPSAPSDAVTKAYVDALPAGMTVADDTMMANISGLTGPALPHSLSDFLDYALAASTRGTMLYRGASGWTALAPGTAGYFLQTGGAGLDPSWQVGGSGVTSITAGAGIDTTPDTITGAGTVALAPIPDKNLLANITGSTAAPLPASLSAYLDYALTNVRGSLLSRTAGGWVALAPGATGYYLQSQGSGADLTWNSPAGAGTVTSINAGTGISTGGAPITGSGSVSLATVATGTVLANISGSSAAPTPQTLSLIIDTLLGATQGAVLYRGASTWTSLTPGINGQVLTTHGSAANPTWATPAAGGSIANLTIASNISGSTAAPVGNTLSNILDATVSSGRGTLLFRGASGWVGLAPGTSGTLLTSGGTSGDPSWTTPAPSGATLAISDTAPASPTAGAMWWDSSASVGGGQLYLYYVDPSGAPGQWVPVSNQPGPQGPPGSGGGSVAWTDITGKPATYPPTLPIAESDVTNLTSDLAAKAPLASPTFSGTPSLPTGTTAVTQAAATNNTSLATTAYVQSQFPLSIAKGGSGQTALPAAFTALAASGGTIGAAVTVNSAATPVLTAVSTSSSVACDIRFNLTGVRSWNAGVKTSGDWYVYDVSNPGDRLVLTTAGTNLCANGSWSATSDARLKTDVRDYERGLREICALRPVRFTWKDSPFNRDGEESFGLIAQEVERVLPELVGEYASESRPDLGEEEREPATYKTLDHNRLVFALVNAIRELEERLAAAEEKLT